MGGKRDGGVDKPGATAAPGDSSVLIVLLWDFVEVRTPGQPWPVTLSPADSCGQAEAHE